MICDELRNAIDSDYRSKAAYINGNISQHYKRHDIRSLVVVVPLSISVKCPCPFLEELLVACAHLNCFPCS